jgi:hypothetical protein
MPGAAVIACLGMPKAGKYDNVRKITFGDLWLLLTPACENMKRPVPY